MSGMSRVLKRNCLYRNTFTISDWNDSKYPRSFPIPRIAENLDIKLNGLENELRQKTNSYNQVKIQLSQSTTKEGNYYVRDLTDILVQPNVSLNDFIYTKFVTTVVVIVPVASQEDFMANIDMLTEYVVPYSAKKFKVPQKDGLSIWKVNIFTQKCQERSDTKMMKKQMKWKRIEEGIKKNQTPIQEFIQKGRERLKVVVKEFKFETGLADNKKKKKDGLQQKLAAHNRSLSDICLAYFSEGFELYTHAKILRLVIQSNMRFGSDPTVFYLLESMPGKDKIVQSMLIEIFGDKENEGLYGTKDEIDDAEDFFPFIYVPVITPMIVLINQC